MELIQGQDEPGEEKSCEQERASRTACSSSRALARLLLTHRHSLPCLLSSLQLILCYLPDWIVTLVLAGLLAIIDHVHGFRREFSLTDTSIQHTFATSERVPVWLLAVCVLVIPVIIIALFSLLICRSGWDCHAALLGLILAHALTITATTIIKVCVGRPRPDLISRCQPRSGSVNGVPFGLVTDAICTLPLDSEKIKQGFRSFPSGHSSASFAGLTFLSLYLAGKLHILDRRGHALPIWIVFFPMLGAVLIAVSRTMDYRHHATDVIAGGLLGALVATMIYHVYYPPLWELDCYKPFQPRTSSFLGDEEDEDEEEHRDAGIRIDRAGGPFGHPDRYLTRREAEAAAAAVAAASSTAHIGGNGAAATQAGNGGGGLYRNSSTNLPYDPAKAAASGTGTQAARDSSAISHNHSHHSLHSHHSRAGHQYQP